MSHGEGNTEKVGMVTCCQEPWGRGPLKRCQSLVFRNATGFYRQLKQVLVDDEFLTHTRVHVEMHSVDTGKLGIEKKVFGERVSPQGAPLSLNCQAKSKKLELALIQEE